MNKTTQALLEEIRNKIFYYMTRNVGTDAGALKLLGEVKEDLTACIAALSSAAPGGDWQPIDTAPRDKRYLGVIFKHDVWGEPFVCEWDEDDGHRCQFQTEQKPHKPTHWLSFEALSSPQDKGEQRNEFYCNHQNNEQVDGHLHCSDCRERLYIAQELEEPVNADTPSVEAPTCKCGEKMGDGGHVGWYCPKGVKCPENHVPQPPETVEAPADMEALKKEADDFIWLYINVDETVNELVARLIDHLAQGFTISKRGRE